MSGELWRSVTAIGKEVTPGTSVPATRKLYLRDPKLTREREPRLHKFATGGRDNQRALTLGPQMAGGSFSLPMSNEEIVELLLIGVKGGVTPTPLGTAVKLWTFKPDPVLDAATIEWDDGARGWEAAGCHLDELTIAGSVSGENEVSGTIFARSVVQATVTAALGERVPVFIEGWQTRLFVDAFGGTPGTTVMAGTLISWDVAFRNNLGRKYFADNLNASGAVTVGELEIECTLVFEASPAAALTEFQNWDAATKRLIRLEFQDETRFIEGAFRPFVTVDIPGGWTAVDLGGDDEGTRSYELGFNYVYDSVLAAGIQFRAQNMRATAY